MTEILHSRPFPSSPFRFLLHTVMPTCLEASASCLNMLLYCLAHTLHPALMQKQPTVMRTSGACCHEMAYELHTIQFNSVFLKQFLLQFRR